MPSFQNVNLPKVAFKFFLKKTLKTRTIKTSLEHREKKQPDFRQEQQK